MKAREKASDIIKNNKAIYFRGATIYVSQIRIDKDTVPDGFHLYAIRHTDTDCSRPATIEPKVLVNHFADVISDKALVFENAADPHIVLRSIERNKISEVI